MELADDPCRPSARTVRAEGPCGLGKRVFGPKFQTHNGNNSDARLVSFWIPQIFSYSLFTTFTTRQDSKLGTPRKRKKSWFLVRGSVCGILVLMPPSAPSSHLVPHSLFCLKRFQPLQASSIQPHACKTRYDSFLSRSGLSLCI